MIKFHGMVSIPTSLVQYADRIKLENYKVNKPGRGQVRHQLTDYMRFTEDVHRVVGISQDRNLDFVYFSCCKGAEPHVDQLSPDKFEDTTFVIPIILPSGRCLITAEDRFKDVVVGGVYEFDHTKEHSMMLEDRESGCVVVMVAIKK